MIITDYPHLAQQVERHWGLTLTTAQQHQLALYYQLLMDHNARINLTRIPDETTFISRHVLDSLSLWPLLTGLPAQSRIVDVGSGGGFPLLPLAIVRPDLQWHSIEATRKKVGCLQAMATDLSLSITFHAERLETLNRQPAHRGQYQAVTARAVAPLNVLLPWVGPLLSPHGRFYAMKGQKAPEELKAAQSTLQQIKRKLVATHQWHDLPALAEASILVFG